MKTQTEHLRDFFTALGIADESWMRLTEADLFRCTRRFRDTLTIQVSEAVWSWFFLPVERGTQKEKAIDERMMVLLWSAFWELTRQKAVPAHFRCNMAQLDHHGQMNVDLKIYCAGLQNGKALARILMIDEDDENTSFVVWRPVDEDGDFMPVVESEAWERLLQEAEE